MKASPSACNAGKYLSPKTKHTRSDRKERNAMLALPNSHRKLCTRRAKDNGRIGEVASPVSGRPKTRGSIGDERELSLPLVLPHCVECIGSHVGFSQKAKENGLLHLLHLTTFNL